MSADPPEDDLATRALIRHRREDAAMALPLLGLLLLVSPILGAMSGFGKILGIPAPVFYVFAVWLGLILLARRLARLLSATEPGP